MSSLNDVLSYSWLVLAGFVLRHMFDEIKEMNALVNNRYAFSLLIIDSPLMSKYIAPFRVEI